MLRLRKKKDFKHVYTHGNKFSTTNFIIFICRNNLLYQRIGITVTRKYGKAVKRNRIKRLIREFFRLNKPLFAKGYDYIILVKNNCQLNNFTELSTELENFFKNAKNSNIYNQII